MPSETSKSGTSDSRDLEDDLAVLLSGNRAVYLRLGPDDAIVSVKSPDTIAFGDAIGVRWNRMTPSARAKAVLDVIRRAAAYCRQPVVHQPIPRESVA